MAVGTIQIQIPIRALWWLKKLAVRQKPMTSVEHLVEGWVLQKLDASEGVDLTRTPTMEE